MTQIFADTSYWIAILSPHDYLSDRATELSSTLLQTRIVTSDLVLAELLNSVAGNVPRMRSVAAKFVREMRTKRTVVIEPLTAESFDGALKLYSDRPDKGWSLTDCLSFLIMQRSGIDSALTWDRHFEQAGYKALLR